MTEISKKWYVIRAISGKEKKVKELLELEIDRHNLNDYVEQVLIPTEKIYQIRKGKKIETEIGIERQNLIHKNEKVFNHITFCNLFCGL